MTTHSRRDLLRGTVALTGLAMLNLPEWALPALAQGETLVPFTDAPPTFPPPGPVNRQYDVRTIDGPFSPADRFFTTQHYGHPVVDPAAFKLKVTGLVNREMELSLEDLRKIGNSELIAGFECSGNRRPLQGLCGNGRWTGVPLKTVLDRAGLKPAVREVVFFGADRGEEEIEFRTQKFKLEQQYGRSMTREQIAGSDAFLAWALNGEPLTRHQGSPLRLLVPGWYGMANVKFLAQIHAQEDAYLGKFQARWYRTLRGENIGGEVKWTEAAISTMQLKSFVARVTRNGDRYNVLGVVLHDGSPLKTVEVSVDGGKTWQAATFDPATRSKYSWKLFNYTWTKPAAGEYTLVSRVIDATGKIQPTSEELESKKTFLEDNSQYPRKVTIG